MAAKDLVAVTSTNEPYLYDAPNVLSLPEGAEFRFRYREPWVDPSLLVRSRETAEEFYRRRLVLVFHSQQTGHLVPLREASVVRVEVLGPVTYVRFKVGKFLAPPSKDLGCEDLRLARATEWGRSLLGLGTAEDLKTILPKGHYFREAVTTPELVTSKLDVAGAWWGVVDLLKGVPALKRLPFFYVLGMASENGKARDWQCLSQSGHYRLRVLEWSFEDQNEPLAFVNCSSSPDLLVLEAASNAIVGQYDVVDFDFVAIRRGKGQLTISLTKFRSRDSGDFGKVEEREAQRGEDNGLNGHLWSQSFHTAIAIRVIPSWWRTLLRFSLAIAGAILYVRIGPVEAAKWWPGSQNAVQGIGLLLFVLGLGSYGERAVTAGKDVRDLAKNPGG